MNEQVMIIAECDPLFRRALRQAIHGLGRNWRIVEAADFKAARKVAEENSAADLMLLDLNMPDVSGFSGLISLRVGFPNLPIVTVSAKDDWATVRLALRFGASGFISKSDNVVLIHRSIQAVLGDSVGVFQTYEDARENDADFAELIHRLHTLTPQQTRVLTMLAEGLPNKQIAYKLNVLETTVKAHVSSILRKLNVGSRTQAVIQINRINTMVTAA